jgi:hypothetical protein
MKLKDIGEKIEKKYHSVCVHSFGTNYIIFRNAENFQKILGGKNKLCERK